MAHDHGLAGRAAVDARRLHEGIVLRVAPQRHALRQQAAVISLIENVAAELGPHRIRVVGIAPGVISTPLLHRGKPERYEAQFKRQPWPDRGEPEVIADVAAFLCSDDARFITGETIKVDGGLLAQGMALFGTGKEATFTRTAGVNRGTTGEAMVVRHLEPKD